MPKNCRSVYDVLLWVFQVFSTGKIFTHNPKAFKILFLTPINYQHFQNIIFKFDQPLPHKPILAQQKALKYTCYNLQI